MAKRVPHILLAAAVVLTSAAFGGGLGGVAPSAHAAAQEHSVAAKRKPPTPPAPEAPVEGVLYSIVATASGKCVDATDWGTSVGTPIQQWECPEPSANQQWRFVPTASDDPYVSYPAYRIVHANTGLFLAEGTYSTNYRVVLSDAADASTTWYLERNPQTGKYTIHAGYVPLLNVAGLSPDNGAPFVTHAGRYAYTDFELVPQG